MSIRLLGFFREIDGRRRRRGGVRFLLTVYHRRRLLRFFPANTKTLLLQLKDTNSTYYFVSIYVTTFPIHVLSEYFIYFTKCTRIFFIFFF